MAKFPEKDFDPKLLEGVINDIKSLISYLSNEEDKPDIEKIMELVITRLKISIIARVEFKGYLIPAGFTEAAAVWQYDNWAPKKQDVLIATFPKTGTTWMSAIVKHLLYKGNEESMTISKKISQNFSYVELSNEYVRHIYDKLPLKRRFYSTHYSSECINMNKIQKSGCKVLYVMRNPKDTLVSWYHFTHGFPEAFLQTRKDMFPKDWNLFFEAFVTGQQADFCKKNEWYPHHILSWYQYKNDKNVKFIYYEDIKKDPAVEIEKISEFLGCKRSKEEILEIVDDTSIRSMRKNDGVEKILFRKGIVGDWKNHFTVAQSEIMDEKFKAVLSGTDVKFKYE